MCYERLAIFVTNALLQLPSLVAALSLLSLWIKRRLCFLHPAPLRPLLERECRERMHAIILTASRRKMHRYLWPVRLRAVLRVVVTAVILALALLTPLTHPPLTKRSALPLLPLVTCRATSEMRIETRIFSLIE